MKNKALVIGIFMLFAGFVGCREEAELALEPGVSRELAMQRKRDISDLSYQLLFRIPEQRAEAVTGHARILFSLREPERVVLDFREKPENIKGVVVNERPVEVRLENEHLIIPKEALRPDKNTVEVEFIAGEQSLNRNDEYLYTLLVPDRARTLFPCFDQPDLKARFSLDLEIPAEWTAVANGMSVATEVDGNRQKVSFAPTEPLSTYLFSFVAGRWERLEETREGRTVALFHRENDPGRLAQVGTIFDQVFASLYWMEEYTGIPYPFSKYDLVIVPGFQFGGMEHAGAILYNDKRMFLNDHPTVAEELGRMELIAHETAHMWFGDYVTMEWFDDVWTKEVFANYFAARMTEPQFPQVNHRLNALRSFFIPAYTEDRTIGSNAIRQPLDNLNSAGLIYGQILYNKAPVVMDMLVGLMGEENFHKGMQEYLRTYAYSNTTWDGLIRILGRYTSEDLVYWSRVWVSEKGMPEIGTVLEAGKLKIRQEDPFHRGWNWPQKVCYALVKEDEKQPGTAISCTEVWLKDSVEEIEAGAGVKYALPNADGKSYGYFALDSETTDFVLAHLAGFADPVLRLSLAMTLYENYQHKRIAPERLAGSLLKLLEQEKDPLIISAAVAYVKSICLQGNIGKYPEIEQGLIKLARQGVVPECRRAAFRALVEVATLPETTEALYGAWERQQPFGGITLGDNDYMKMAYELSVRFPERYEALVDGQKKRLTNPDRLREFEFIARAAAPSEEMRDSLFRSLLLAENRRLEPWVAQVIYYLNHPLRQEQAVKYLRPTLDELEEVQRTGDIFFPTNWVSSCLRGHYSPEATAVVRQFLQEHPDYPFLLKNKLLQNSDHLLRGDTLKLH